MKGTNISYCMLHMDLPVFFLPVCLPLEYVNVRTFPKVIWSSHLTELST